MVFTLSTTVRTAATYLALSKTSGRLGVALARPNKDLKSSHLYDPELSETVKCMSIECNTLYTRLEELADKYATVQPPSSLEDERLWRCLATQAEHITATIRDLTQVLWIDEPKDPNHYDHVQRANELRQRQTRTTQTFIIISRQTEYLSIFSLLVNMCVHSESWSTALTLSQCFTSNNGRPERTDAT